MFGADPRRPWLAARSIRSLRAAGFTAIRADDETDELPAGPALLLRAGQVLRAPKAFRPPPAGGGVPLIAIGLPATADDGGPHPWHALHARHGGDYPAELPPPVCEWHADGASLAARLRGGGALPAGRWRIVHWGPLDLAAADERLRVLEVVTSLQHGGAERIARDLAAGLPAHGVRSQLVVLGRPHRLALAAPPGTLDLSHLDRAARSAVLVDYALEAGADVLHLHLTHAEETRALAASGIPAIATVHNARAGWPQGWQELGGGDLALMLACSQAVEAELREALPHLPVRTVWNGIDPREFPETPHPSDGRHFTLACVANPRPQKRLERLPAILLAVREELARRGVADPQLRLVIAGETSPRLADALASREAFEREASRCGVAERIEWTKGLIPVREVLAGAHALVSCSAHEGLSLAHLEALSTGLPVIACDTGGTRELAWRQPAVTLLPAEATAGDFATAIADALLTPPPSGHRGIWRDFTTDTLLERVALFARQAACRPPSTSPGRTLWFVTNNLSTGGAQSSLRRLAKALHQRGRAVKLALLQEYPEHPTAGRLDLLETGIPVFVPPPAGLATPAEAVERILAEMTAAPPVAVVFWNAIATHKLLLADALPFTPLHDVSPGGMWHDSFDRCFANPPPGLPCRSAADYGRHLSSVVVKYAAEAPRAAAFGAPVKVIPNGVPLPEPAPRRQRELGAPLVFATAARISPQKRLDELIAAFRLALPDLPPAVLKIAGGVETGAEACAAGLAEEARDLPVEWLGETRNLAAFHAGCDLFVMISDPPGCPNASLEALAAGLPVIATDIGGASEQVIDDLNGRLLPARDIPALARAMVELAHDPARREAMGNAAREHIHRHFTIERMIEDYERQLGEH